MTNPKSKDKHLYVSNVNHARLRVAAARLGISIKEATDRALKSYLIEMEERLDDNTVGPTK